MKALVIGGGSIGARHARNLKTLGVSSVALVEPNADRRDVVCREVGAEGHGEVQPGLDWGPDVVVVASPNHLHVEHAIAAAERGCPVFVEKPLSHSAAGLEELAGAVNSRNLVSLVGCNMRFHPGPAKVKELIGQGIVGRILFLRIHTGSYLPGWRPWQDYRQSYSARAEMGGGCILDCIHEIDLARWYVGEAAEVFCEARRTDSLEITTEDYAFLLCRHTSGVRSEIHLDYVQRTYERGCVVVGERGSIFWDYREGSARAYEAESDTWTSYAQPASWEPNDMYLDEFRHFLSCAESRRQTTLPIEDGVKVMRLALAAKESADCGRFVRVCEDTT